LPPFFLYGADPTVSAQGTPAYKTRTNGGKKEGRWIAFDYPEINLGPRQERKVNFSVNVPADTDNGEYRVGITMEKTKKDTNNPNITIATRFILHASVKVTGDPQAVPRKGEGAAIDNQWQIYYFYGSLTLFIVSFFALIWVTVQEKKEANMMSAPSKASPKRKSSAKAKKPAHKRAAAKKKTTRKKK